MRKLIIGAMLIMIILSLTSCIGGSRVAMLNKAGDSGKAEARLEQIIDAINSKDRDAIMAIFSEKALSESEDIDGGIDYLFSLFEDEIDSWERLAGQVSENNDHGRRDKRSIYVFAVYSGEKAYRVAICEDTVDTEHPENIGVYYITATNDTDEKPNYYMGGIYVPFDEDGAARIRFERLLDLIKSKNKDEIKALFSDISLSEARDIDGEIDHLLSLFPNGIDSWEQVSSYAKRWITNSVKEIRTLYVYEVYVDGEAYWLEIGEYLDWTTRPEIIGVSHIIVSPPEVDYPVDTDGGITFLEE